MTKSGAMGGKVPRCCGVRASQRRRFTPSGIGGAVGTVVMAVMACFGVGLALAKSMFIIACAIASGVFADLDLRLDDVMP